MAAAEEVYSFLSDQNRPFSANEVAQNVGKEHGKTAIQKALDKLVSGRKILEKTYGKQKIYCVVQPDGVPSDTGDELKKLDREINEVSANLKEVEEKLQRNTSELKSVQGKMTTSQARTEMGALKNEIADLKVKLAEFRENAAGISEEEKKKITAEHEKYVKEYRKRKRISMDVLNSILENYPKTKKHLLEDIGIETDEDVGFKLE